MLQSATDGSRLFQRLDRQTSFANSNRRNDGRDARTTRSHYGPEAHATRRSLGAALAIWGWICGASASLITLLLFVSLAIVSLLGGAGCAAERAAEKVSAIAGQTALALLEKSNITSTDAFAQGRINNPHYRVLGAVINGVILDIGLDGVELAGGVRGSGSGPDKQLSAETLESLRRQLAKDDFETITNALKRP